MADLDPRFQRGAVEAAIRIGLLFVLVLWCFEIIRPFITPVVWAVILAVALYPMFCKLKSWLGGRGGLAAALIAIVGMAILLLPGFQIAASAVDSVAAIGAQLEEGSFSLPPPASAVKAWPLVGDLIFQHWSQASTDIEKYLLTYAADIKRVVGGAAAFAASLFGGILMFCLSLAIAAFLMANGAACEAACRRIAFGLLDERGGQLMQLSRDTIQSVAKGVLGVAVIQSTLIAVGFFVVGVPGAAVLYVVLLVVAIAQLPSILVVVPVIIYVFQTETTLVAILFTAWSVLAGLSDNVLKPMLLGRGIDVPMLVILLGSLGGMLMSGFIGLFVGAVVLALGYQLFMGWLEINTQTPQEDSPRSE
ncbi:AI-2E family transporter [Ferrimonas gelatinilytica]|uniref:AI-2E family transporter n=1 Tax=Ferrimonas gelatinilytica TaxID=1255257 RepID=A0ABP9S7I8_9GAMM